MERRIIGPVINPAINATDLIKAEEVAKDMRGHLLPEFFARSTANLGEIAGKHVLGGEPLDGRRILVVTSAEDADHYTRMLVLELENRRATVFLCCVWTNWVGGMHRETGAGHSIVRRYLDPAAESVDEVVFSRSIMNTESEWLAVSSMISTLSSRLTGAPVPPQTTLAIGVMTGQSRWRREGDLGCYLGRDPLIFACVDDYSGYHFSNAPWPLHVRLGFTDERKVWSIVPKLIERQMMPATRPAAPDGLPSPGG